MLSKEKLLSMDKIAKYRQLCSVEPSIPLFCRDWWLDAVAPGYWDVVLVEKNGDVVAAMPYVTNTRRGFRFIQQPALTQVNGPWLARLDGREQKRRETEKALYLKLIKQLPRFDHFSQNWHFKVTNWLPFFWQGFQQTTRYTYRLEDLSNLDIIWDGLSSNIRREIRKAEGRFSLKLRAFPTIDEFLELNSMTFERQGMKLPYSKELVQRLDEACAQKECRKIFIAEDPEGNAHAAVYIVWDETNAYYLMGGGNPSLRTSGATSFVMWEAIKHSASITKSFDFEGSMIEPVEKFFRAFGATQTAYHNVYKTNGRLLKLFRALKGILVT